MLELIGKAEEEVLASMKDHLQRFLSAFRYLCHKASCARVTECPAWLESCVPPLCPYAMTVPMPRWVKVHVDNGDCTLGICRHVSLKKLSPHRNSNIYPTLFVRHLPHTWWCIIQNCVLPFLSSTRNWECEGQPPPAHHGLCAAAVCPLFPPRPSEVPYRTTQGCPPPESKCPCLLSVAVCFAPSGIDQGWD